MDPNEAGIDNEQRKTTEAPSENRAMARGCELSQAGWKPGML